MCKVQKGAVATAPETKKQSVSNNTNGFYINSSVCGEQSDDKLLIDSDLVHREDLVKVEDMETSLHHGDDWDEVGLNAPSDFYNMEIPQQEELKHWITTKLAHRKTINYGHTSDGLKHTFERSTYGFYITNGMFKGAMLLCGFDKHNSGINWSFAITEKCIKETRKMDRWYK